MEAAFPVIAMTPSAEELGEPRHDAVRAVTDPEVNQWIDERIERTLRLYAGSDRATITQRLDELDREWDMERVLECNAASVALTGLVLGTLGTRKWFILPTIVAGFLLHHAIRGWCPPITWFRRMGIRTRKEIERERQALKLVRGDFEGFKASEPADVAKIMEMVDRR